MGGFLGSTTGIPNRAARAWRFAISSSSPATFAVDSAALITCGSTFDVTGVGFRSALFPETEDAGVAVTADDPGGTAAATTDEI